jgi:hypothetical protein
MCHPSISKERGLVKSLLTRIAAHRLNNAA